MRREADTKESRLAQKRQERAEKKLLRKRDELQKEKEKRYGQFSDFSALLNL